jgi:arylsulfatase A-like enzyme
LYPYFVGEKICSPARSSLQTGRLGIHVNVQNVFPEVRNPEDPVGGYQGTYFIERYLINEITN